MSIEALQAARTKLIADAPLTAFFTTRYGRAAKHFIGYKKPVNANDFPAICYVPAVSHRADAVGGWSKERVSLVVAIHEPGITSDQFDGVIQLAAIEQLIFACLEPGQLGANAIHLGEARVVNDLAIQHPFHEMEISMLLAAR
jgi:hypothetical protein